MRRARKRYEKGCPIACNLFPRFLHVLQGADPGAAEVPATYMQSSAGTPFDGAVFGSSAVYFPVTAGGAFSGATLPAPAGVHTILVTGLTPNASYAFAVQAASAGNVVAVTAGSGATADAAGGPKTDVLSAAPFSIRGNMARRQAETGLRRRATLLYGSSHRRKLYTCYG